jgi:hypothetical protein
VELTAALRDDAVPTRLRPLAVVVIRILASAPVAYLAIVLLQLKVVWGMWWVKDLTSGDTSEYFLHGYRWYEKGANVIAWSPLYTTFYGSLLFLSRDAYVATLAHRLFIVFALALLVLTLMRRLLAPWAAWLVTAWWVVLPINYDTLYEVHLFVVVPLVGALIVLTRPGPWRRGIALAAFLATTLLMRNEFLIATAGLAALCAAAEAHSRWRRQQRGSLTPYLVPVLGAVALTCVFYARSSVKYPQLTDALRRKHNLNVCQIVAYGYQQRHTEWTPSPWTECQGLMVQLFDRPELSLGEAIRANPSAIWEHLLWNTRLIPGGVQLLLFNEISGSESPDYAPIRRGSSTAGLLSIAWLGLLAVALLGQVRERRYWWTTWIGPRRWAWAGLGLLAATAGFVMLMQRPRPSYLFPLGLGLMVSTGLALQMVARRWPTRWMRRLVPVPVALLLLAVVPTYASRKPSSSRPLMESYRRLLPVIDSIRGRDGVVVTSGFPNELCNYFALGRRCRDYYALRREVEAGSAWAEVLRRHSVVLVYLSEDALSDPWSGPLSTAAAPDSWIASGTSDRGTWTILRKSYAEPGPGPRSSDD